MQAAYTAHKQSAEKGDFFLDFMIVVAVTADVMFAAMACGTAGFGIPWYSRLCMAAVSSGFLIVSAAGKSVLLQDLPQDTIRWIGFIALVCIGLMQIFGERISRQLGKTTSQILAPVRVGAAVFLDHTRADSDHSNVLSIPESIVLAIPVSIDSLIGGLGVSACGSALISLLGIAFVWNFFAVWYGRWFGTKIPIPSERARSIFCGAVLIALGFWKLV